MDEKDRGKVTDSLRQDAAQRPAVTRTSSRPARRFDPMVVAGVASSLTLIGLIVAMLFL